MSTDLTLDDYLAVVNPPDDMSFHLDALCQCIATFEHGTKYIVRQRSGEKITYGFYDGKGLKDLLSHKTVRVTLPNEKKKKDIKYAKLLGVSEINHGFMDFEEIDFAGNRPNVFNIWTGHVFPTDMAPNMALIEPWLNHVKFIICGGNELLYRIEMAKNAYMVQNPNEKVMWATVLLGRAGCGKGSYTDVLCSIWGERWSEPNISNIQQLTGDSSRSTLSWKKLIVVNELSKAKQGSKEFEALKTMITDGMYRLRDLYQIPMTLRNVNNFIFVSNHWDSVVINKDDRRYFVLGVSPAKIGKIEEYFVPLRATFTDEMRTSLLNYLLTFDWRSVPEFKPFEPFETDIKKELREYWESAPQTFMQEYKCEDPEGEIIDSIYSKFEQWCSYNDVRNKCAKAENPIREFGMQIREFVEKRNGKLVKI
jgi:hypothetical protein